MQTVRICEGKRSIQPSGKRQCHYPPATGSTTTLRLITVSLENETRPVSPENEAKQPGKAPYGKTGAVTAFICPASSINLSRPASVSGCFNRPRMASGGEVQTWAPASAH